MSTLPLAALLAVLLPGCHKPQLIKEPRPGPVTGMTAAEADTKAEAARRDPEAYLELVAAKCRALSQYSVLFTRYERRGLLFRTLYGPEHMRCWFRRKPFSVRMHWLDGDSKYVDMVFAAGEADNQVRFVTRHWSPPLAAPPAVNRVAPDVPVQYGESRQPITDFGLERLMERTLASLHEAGGQVVLQYVGLETLPDDGTTVHHLHFEYPPGKQRVPVMELYIAVATDLPAGTILKVAGGTWEASYFYTDLNPHVRLTDVDFKLPQEGGTKAPPGATTQPVAATTRSSSPKR